MNLILDIHTHTIASGHAYGTIREMAQAASERGLKLLGFAEHGPKIPGAIDPFYFRNFVVIPRTLYGVEILHGCEINVLNDGTLDLEQELIDKLDFGIAGIHVQCYENVGREKNTDNLLSCMANDKIFFVSHPDDDHTPLNYERLVDGAKKFHVALEVNNSSFVKEDKRLNCRENYRTMLALCEKFSVPIIVSSDAHDPSGVGEFTPAKKFLQEINFDETLILNTDVDKLKNFIRF